MCKRKEIIFTSVLSVFENMLKNLCFLLEHKLMSLFFPVDSVYIYIQRGKLCKADTKSV